MSPRCLCGHRLESHLDGIQDWTACCALDCGCVGYTEPRVRR